MKEANSNHAIGIPDDNDLKLGKGQIVNSEAKRINL